MWANQRNDIRDFVSSCVLSLLSKIDNKVPRPLSTSFHASRLIKVIQFDYVFLGQSDKPKKYALVLKDDSVGYVSLEPSASADFEHATKALSRRNRLFIAPDVYVADRGSYFENRVLVHLSSMQRIRPNLTVAYSPWANGTVECVVRSVLSAAKPMLSELMLTPQNSSVFREC